MTEIPQMDLNSGDSIPQYGFGTWQIEPEDAAMPSARRSAWATAWWTRRPYTATSGRSARR